MFWGSRLNGRLQGFSEARPQIWRGYIKQHASFESIVNQGLQAKDDLAARAKAQPKFAELNIPGTQFSTHCRRTLVTVANTYRVGACSA